MSRPSLMFIDDDPAELDQLATIVQEEYDYLPVKWPDLDLDSRPVPSIIALDLYFPGKSAPSTMGTEAVTRQKAAAQGLAQRFLDLYETNLAPPALLRETFTCVQSGYDLLWDQCAELGQSSAGGRDLLARLRQQERFRRVPIVFYSRKVTVPEAVRALEAGAWSVIVKARSSADRTERERVLSDLRLAEASFKRYSSRLRTWLLRSFGIQQLNITVVEHVMHKATGVEIVGAKLG